MASNAKNKGPISPPEDKKKATSTRVAKKGETSVATLGEGTSANPVVALGLEPPSLEVLLWQRKSLGESFCDKEKVEKLTLDQVATKFFHIIGQVFIRF